MGYVFDDSKEQRALCPAGMTQAVCVRVLGFGHQDTFYGVKDQVELSWITSHVMADGELFQIRRAFNIAHGAKSGLTKLLTSWRGKAPEKGFALADVLLQPATISVEHSVPAEAGGTIYANLGAIMPGTPGALAVPAHLRPFVAEHPDRAALNANRENIQDWLWLKVSDGWAALDKANGADKAILMPGSPEARRVVDNLDDDIEVVIDDKIVF